jgi:hypothetical protein
MSNQQIGNDFKYGVAIRTRGYSEKLKHTLYSLLQQSIKPSEIVIVIPYGVDSWKVDSYDNVVSFARSKKKSVKTILNGHSVSFKNYVESFCYRQSEEGRFLENEIC